ncbi:MAG: hypothetical protein AB8H86_08480 [Polyangiales bacterium]
MTIAHRLSTQGATLELEMCVLGSVSDDVQGTLRNLRLVAATLKELAAELVACAEQEARR